MLMRALSIVKPGGTLIARGVKRVEVRTWKPENLPIESLLIVENSRFLRSEAETDPEGLAVAVVRVTEVHAWRHDEFESACATYFEEGWLAWTLDEIRPIPQPFRVVAKRMLYDVIIDPTLILLK